MGLVGELPRGRIADQPNPPERIVVSLSSGRGSGVSSKGKNMSFKVSIRGGLAVLFGASIAWVGAALLAGSQDALAGRAELPLPNTASWQVETGDQPDVETLDQGTPPPASAVSPSEGDVELLDQGTPPPAPSAAPVGATTGAAPIYEPTPAPAAPATQPGPAYAAPAPTQPSGPTLPPGFGTGQVHVSAGQFGFPVGLESCHVGAVTGRAYVGLRCDGGDSMVGHAPSFSDFPFVPAASFPFEGDEAFLTHSGVFANGSAGTSGGGDVIVSAGQHQETSNSTANNSGGASSTNTKSTKGTATKAQRARTNEPRVTTTQSQSTQTKGKKSDGTRQSAKSNGSHDTAQKAKGSSHHHKKKAKAQHGNKKHKAHGGKKHRDKEKKRKS
jgi:hypothetical protein